MSNPLVLSQLRVMQEQERSSSYRCTDYISKSQVLSSLDRQALCNWGYQTIAACQGVSRSTAVLSFTYFDRFLSSNTPAARRALNDVTEAQLAFVTSLVIALKCHSGFKVETDFVSNVVTKNYYDADEISNMEIEILQGLDWKLNGPMPHDFIDYFLDLVPNMNGTCSEFVKNFSRSLVELSMSTYTVALHYPSQIAFTSICCALLFSNRQPLLVDNLPFLQLVSGLNIHDVVLRSLFATMNNLVWEFLSDFDVDVEDAQSQNEDIASFSSDASPTAIVGSDCKL